jgi:hypothetical protein
MKYKTTEIVYCVPESVNEVVFRGTKKQVERNLLKFYGLR